MYQARRFCSGNDEQAGYDPEAYQEVGQAAEPECYVSAG